MTARPLAVILISFLYIIAGATGILYHFSELLDFNLEQFWILMIRILAVVGGFFSLRGANWARWLLIAWIAYHVGISFYHTWVEVLAHAGFFLLTAVALYTGKAKAFFRQSSGA